MSVLDVIRSRREITSFINKKIPNELLGEIVDAAYYAPSGNNLLSREFVVIEDREKLDHLEKTTPFMKWMSSAQAAIVITGRPDVSKYWLQDASIACAFIWLTAADLGVGVGFGAVYHSEDAEESRVRETHVREALNIPADRRVVAVLGLGFPAENPKEKKMLDRDETVFYGGFGEV
ncbi:nitroreductase family protein [Bacillus niameyensis]|uniref:nitroreductase family protein n=1 Tax=Bacillus niameyensis TaxID=1522308 RepID=UPI000784A7E7|nr:nitroreductase family protein [Bacillus niameyensis]